MSKPRFTQPYSLVAFAWLVLPHLSWAQEHPNIQPTADLCPSYAPSSGPMACDPKVVAAEINGLTHPINWSGTADSAWNAQHSPCSSNDLEQLGKDLEDYHENKLGYWSGGVFASLRNASPGFWDKRRQLVTGYFNSVVADPEIRNACCAGNALCIKRFTEVKLNISEDGSGVAGIGEYDADSHSVGLSKPALIQEMYEEPIQRLVLHELGHACDAALYYSENPANPTKVTDNQPVEGETVHLKARLGHDFYSCFEAESKADPQFGSMSSQPATEAFAEAVFSFRYTNALDWISLGAYGGYKWADRCVLKTPELKKRVCTGPSSAAVTATSALRQLAGALESPNSCSKNGI